MLSRHKKPRKIIFLRRIFCFFQTQGQKSSVFLKEPIASLYRTFGLIWFGWFYLSLSFLKFRFCVSREPIEISFGARFFILNYSRIFRVYSIRSMFIILLVRCLLIRCPRNCFGSSKSYVSNTWPNFSYMVSNFLCDFEVRVR